MEENNSKRLHIAALAFPYGSHATPLLTLLQRLATFLPTNTVFSFFSTEKSNSHTFSNKMDPFDNIKPYSVWDGMPVGQVFSGDVQVGTQFFLKVVPGNFKKAMGEAEAESGVKISCLLTDVFLWFSADMASEMGVPWVAFWAAGSCSLSVYMYRDEIKKKLGMLGIPSGRVRFLEEIELIEKKRKILSLISISGMTVHVDDLPGGVLFGNLKTPLAQMLYKMDLTLPRATVVVLNSFEEIDPKITNDLKLKLRKVLCVGPSTLSSPLPLNVEENGCLLWLEKQKPSSVAYISFGTIVRPPPEEILILAETLEVLKVPFLWSHRDHTSHPLPEGFVESTVSFGKVVSWAPQSQVLAHPSIGAFVTHGGWNSILESISGGVPMICRPLFGDQMLNSRMVQDLWLIGVTVEGRVFSKTGIIRAFELVLSHEQGKQMRENIRELKKSAVAAVGPIGSSTANFETLVKVIKTCKHRESEH